MHAETISDNATSGNSYTRSIATNQHYCKNRSIQATTNELYMVLSVIFL